MICANASNSSSSSNSNSSHDIDIDVDVDADIDTKMLESIQRTSTKYDALTKLMHRMGTIIVINNILLSVILVILLLEVLHIINLI